MSTTVLEEPKARRVSEKPEIKESDWLRKMCNDYLRTDDDREASRKLSTLSVALEACNLYSNRLIRQLYGKRNERLSNEYLAIYPQRIREILSQ